VKEFWRGLERQNAHVTASNSHLMREVKEGNFIFGYTDTDDFRKAADEGKPVRMVYPDQEVGGEIDGCIVIPNSVSMIEGCPHPDNAKKLIDYILRRETERRLANGPSAQMPVRKGIEKPGYVKSAADLHTLTIDWEEVAKCVEPFRAWFDEFYAD
jgi:iron(III) transport system substrate-binding protein